MTLDQLECLISPVIEGRFLEKKGQLMALKIVRRVFRDSIETEHHALVRVCPDSVRKRLIKFINNNTYRESTAAPDQVQKVISASEFVIRHYSNDRRMGINNAAHVEKRQKDRREFGSKMIPIFEKTYADSDLSGYVGPQENPPVK